MNDPRKSPFAPAIYDTYSKAVMVARYFCTGRILVCSFGFVISPFPYRILRRCGLDTPWSMLDISAYGILTKPYVESLGLRPGNQLGKG